jgi:hypothetical protein
MSRMTLSMSDPKAPKKRPIWSGESPAPISMISLMSPQIAGLRKAENSAPVPSANPCSPRLLSVSGVIPLVGAILVIPATAEISLCLASARNCPENSAAAGVARKAVAGRWGRQALRAVSTIDAIATTEMSPICCRVRQCGAAGAAGVLAACDASVAAIASDLSINNPPS